MEREQILRDDFPTSRKGWDPDAVRAHLSAVADSATTTPAAGGESLADAAAERVRSVIAAAEVAAAEILAEAQAAADSLLIGAREESDGMLGSARGESEQLVTRAREEASARVEQARAAVEGLVSQADELRTRVGTLGEELAGSIRSSADSIGSAGTADAAAEVPGPVIVPEPTPPTIPEPTPAPVPEPTPLGVSDSPQQPPDLAPVPDLPDDSGPLEPAAPDPVPEPPAAVSASASTDDLIAQLRGGSQGAADNGSEVAPAVSGSDLGAARLVALNMALDGASREEISAQLRAEFGDVEELDGLLDEVLARAGR